MSNGNIFYELPGRVQRHLDHAIKQLGLTAINVNSGKVWLENDVCRIELENYGENYVGFNFFDRRDPLQKKYLFGNFIDAEFGGMYLQWIPNSQTEWSDLETLTYYLDNYNRLLLQGCMDLPLSGDQSWKGRYDAYAQKYEEYSHFRAKLRRENHPEAMPIFVKMRSGDPTWMDDIERIMKEQGL